MPNSNYLKPAFRPGLQLTALNGGVSNRSQFTMKKLTFAVLLALELTVPAFAQAPASSAATPTSLAKFSPLPQTLYRGKFGKTEAVACFSVDSKGRLDGGYYDEKFGKWITLGRDEPSAEKPQPDVLEEGDMAGHGRDGGGKNADWNPGIWWFDELNANKIRGHRRDLETGAQVAFDMEKTATVTTDCQNAVEASRHLVERIMDREHIGGVEFVTYANQWTKDEDSTSDPDAGVIGLRIEHGLNDSVRKKINKALRQAVDAANSEWFNCRESNFSQELSLLTKTYLTISERSSGYCGGLHANHDVAVRVFDLRTGKLVDIEQWIDRTLLAKSEKKGAIRKAIVESEKGIEDRCLDYLDTNHWHVNETPFWMSKEGVAFYFNPSTPAFLECEENYTISFKTFRKVILPKAKPAYDHYVTELKKAQ
jgi:hypothetical protein